jgi:threonine synthase
VSAAPPRAGVIARYGAHLRLPPGCRVITLHEGDTPLVRLGRLPAELGLDLALYAKFEGMNPTGSFKDRGMTVAVTHAVSEGARALICASTGNTSASAAAYAARAGIAAFVLIPAGKVALGKLAQAIAYGAHVLQIEGDFDAGMALVRALAAQAAVAVVNSINPWRIEGQKTAAFEIVDALGRAPDIHCLPVGNAGNISAYWKGYREYHAAGRIAALPVMLGYQAAGAAPLVHGAPVERAETLATAIRIGRPQSWDSAVAAARESGGHFAAVTDEEILAAQRLLAAGEGIYCEPASAASLAGLINDARAGRIPAGSCVVLTLTGHGLKDPEIALRGAPALAQVPAEAGAIARAIGERLART